MPITGLFHLTRNIINIPTNNITTGSINIPTSEIFIQYPPPHHHPKEVSTQVSSPRLAGA
jgi:hypothetical protein